MKISFASPESLCCGGEEGEGGELVSWISSISPPYWIGCLPDTDQLCPIRRRNDECSSRVSCKKKKKKKMFFVDVLRPKLLLLLSDRERVAELFNSVYLCHFPTRTESTEGV